MTPRVTVDLIDVEHELFELPQKVKGSYLLIHGPATQCLCRNE